MAEENLPTRSENFAEWYNQIVLKADNPISYIDHEVDGAFDLFKETVDIGDFVEVSGTLFVTRKGQRSVEVNGWRMLTKPLLPIPDGWYGLKDDDERFRNVVIHLLRNRGINRGARGKADTKNHTERRDDLSHRSNGTVSALKVHWLSIPCKTRRNCTRSGAFN